MTLTDEDREILRLSKRERELHRVIDAGPWTDWKHSPHWPELQRVRDELRRRIYQGAGFRGDLKHLLDGCTLDVSLLDETPTQGELL